MVDVVIPKRPLQGLWGATLVLLLVPGVLVVASAGALVVEEGSVVDSKTSDHMVDAVVLGIKVAVVDSEGQMVQAVNLLRMHH